MNALRPILASICALLAMSAFANCSVVLNNHEKTPDAHLTDNANGTITHTGNTNPALYPPGTGLIWKQCVQGLSGAGCATGTATTYTWQGALQQAVSETLTATDWRLPSRNELLSIVESACASNMINVTRFPNAPANALYWTSTPGDEGNPVAAWAVNFGNGTLVAADKSTTAYVRLVRSGTAGETFNQRSSLPATGPSNGFPLFTAATGQTVGTLATSSAVTLAGITGTVPLSIAGGEYQISATVTFANATDIITWTAHPLRVNDRVSFANSGGALPTGITAGTLYYVIAGSLAANTFQISTTPGGTAVNFTTDGTGTNTARLDWQGNTYTRTSTVTFTNATDLVNLTAHGLAAGASVIFSNSGGALPTGITAGTRYYLISSGMTANAFQISTEPGGTALNFTTDGTGTTTASITWPNATRNVGNWTIQVRAVAASTGGTTNTATLTINNRATSFAVTTLEPTPVTIPAKTGVARSTAILSDPVAVTGLTAARAISISGGTSPQFRLSSNGGATWGSWITSGTINNNDLVQVQQTSSATATTPTTTTLTINSQASVFSVTTGAAVEPTDMSFPAVANAERGAFVESSPATLSGLTTTRAVTFTGGGSGNYSLSADNGVTWSAWTATGNVGTADNGKLIKLRLTASTTASTLVTATLNINARAFNFAVTTGAALDPPSPIYLGEAYNVTAGSGTAISDVAVISGLSTATATISISGTNATYSKNAAAYTNVAGTVVNNDQITVRITPMPNCSYSPATATLSINGYAFPFTAWTGAGPAGPTTFAGYTNITGAARGSTIQSATAPAVSGLAVSPSCISIRGEGDPQYQINGGTWTNATATVANTNTISVRLNTPNSSQQTLTLWLMINGTEYPFSVTTQ